ncbi:hypothetical protein IE53DRAFT_406215 [Violaceomyces palustris]|uniref:Uncharacterized protein n=1 Tax=Violaceomyces palustris TaxID=1673888 RepID=A0ACD0NWZ1_9BASI|nr:hypothetical protein IE53DRAFT_406215 [Violaceomyces palustris]
MSDPQSASTVEKEESRGGSVARSHAKRLERRDYEKIPDSKLSRIASLGDPKSYLDHRDPSSLLSKILIPRVPDTDNITFVRQTILEVFEKQLGAKGPPEGHGRLGWHVETPTFHVDTPEGRKKMTNIVLTKNPAAPRKLVLSAHYDSKYFSARSGMSGFVGATDSAAPCAMLVDVAVALDEALDSRERRIASEGHSSSIRSEETTLQLVFFDGEEAFRFWTHQDSIYGSKQLAMDWTTQYWDPANYLDLETSHAPKLSRRRLTSKYGPVKHIDTIEMLVLLDLLGTRDPTVPSFFESTEWAHREWQGIEKRLSKLGLLYPAGRVDPSPSFFTDRKSFGGIEDDHLPFLANGVPILHIIPSPFPSVWHKLSDNADALDYPTVYAWSMILRVFVSEYLSLDFSESSRRTSSPQTAESIQAPDAKGRAEVEHQGASESFPASSQEGCLKLGDSVKAKRTFPLGTAR